MKEFLSALTDFGPWTVAVRLLAAALMGGLIGSERGRHGRAAGLRTHILICIGAAITSLTGVYLSVELGNNGDIARLSAQVISGIGFLGAGTIMIRNSSMITGLTTAAGMWATAAIGVAVGYGFYAGAFIATVICIFSVTMLSRLERKSKRKSNSNIYIELADITATEQVIETVRQSEDLLISYDIIPPKSGHSENVGLIFVMGGEKYFAETKDAVYQIGKIAMMINDINF